MDARQIRTRNDDAGIGAVGVVRAVDDADERARLRRFLLHLGASLDWSREEIVRFAEAAANRPWASLNAADLAAAVRELQTTIWLLTAWHAHWRRRAEALDVYGD